MLPSTAYTAFSAIILWGKRVTLGNLGTDLYLSSTGFRRTWKNCKTSSLKTPALLVSSASDFIRERLLNKKFVSCATYSMKKHPKSKRDVHELVQIGLLWLTIVSGA